MEIGEKIEREFGRKGKQRGRKRDSSNAKVKSDLVEDVNVESAKKEIIVRVIVLKGEPSELYAGQRVLSSDSRGS